VPGEETIPVGSEFGVFDMGGSCLYSYQLAHQLVTVEVSVKQSA
jgi:hypothetical protein